MRGIVVWGERAVLLADAHPVPREGVLWVPDGSTASGGCGAPADAAGFRARPVTGVGSASAAASPTSPYSTVPAGRAVSGGRILPGRPVRPAVARDSSLGGLDPAGQGADAALALAGWRRELAGLPAGPALAVFLAARPGRGAPAQATAGAGAGETAPEEPSAPTIPNGAADPSGAGATEPSGVRWANAIVDSLAARQRLIAHLHAEQLADLAALAGGYPGLREFLPAEIALALGVAESTAGGYLDEATETLQRLPGTFAALHAGRITPVKAATIRSHTRDLDPAAAARVENDVLGRAGTQTVPQLREALARAVLRRDPHGAQHRHDEAAGRRGVGVHPKPDGMAGLWAYGPAQDVTAIAECVAALARAAKTPGDARTADNRRFDALVDICTAILDSGSWQGVTLPQRRTGRPHIHVTMPITALLGSDDEPCELAGYGPISAAQARRIAADGHLRRLVCDPLTGVLLDYGRTRYRPPDSLAQFVQARDRTCPMPGCRQPAHNNPIDHIQPFHPGRPAGGPTAAHNLAAPCEHHHRAKDGGGFTLTRHSDGGYTWTTPLHRTHHREPTQLWNPHNDPVTGREHPNPTAPESPDANRTGPDPANPQQPRPAPPHPPGTGAPQPPTAPDDPPPF